MSEKITVSADGNGDFKTISKALEYIACGNFQAPVIKLKNGLYNEQVEIKIPNLTIIGESAYKTIISGSLSANLMHCGERLGTFRSYTVFVDANDFTARNLTIENTAGAGSEVGQAIALYADGDRLCFDNCRILGGQDTLFTAPLPPSEKIKNGFVGPKQFSPRINGRQYYKNCYISGDVDFIFGGATAFFEGCDIFSIYNGNPAANGFIAAASTAEGQAYGYVFKGCRFLSDCPPQTVYLGRPWRDFAKTVIINSYIGAHISPLGWDDWGSVFAHFNAFYAEGGNFGEGAITALRPPWTRALSESEIKRYSKHIVLGGNDDWF